MVAILYGTQVAFARVTDLDFRLQRNPLPSDVAIG